MNMMLEGYIFKVSSLTEDRNEIEKDEIIYFERFIELLIDLSNQLPTRRFFMPLLHSSHFTVRCRLSILALKEEMKGWLQQLEILEHFVNFEIDDMSGAPLTQQDMTQMHYDKLARLQNVCFDQNTDKLKLLALTSISNIDTEDRITEWCEKMPLETMMDICLRVCYLDVKTDCVFKPLWEKIDASNKAWDEKIAKEEANENANMNGKKKKKKKKKRPIIAEETGLRLMLRGVFLNQFKRRQYEIDRINASPLFPTEQIIWDPNLVPEEHYDGDYSLALPKLNLQFLTIHDYLLRNFDLFRLESTYDIRGDVEDSVRRLKPVPSDYQQGKVEFKGMSRMAVKIDAFSITSVKNPKVDETVPAEVRAEITFNLRGLNPSVRQEWDQLRDHDVCFPIAIQPVLNEKKN